MFKNPKINGNVKKPGPINCKSFCCLDMFPSFLDLWFLTWLGIRKQCNLLLVEIVVIKSSSRKENVFRYTMSGLN